MLTHPPQILIVEDSTSIRKMLAMRLSKFGAEITQACDGLTGLALAQKKHFDLILTDVDMPNMSGLEMTVSLKQQPETQKIPVIFLSSMDTDQDVERGFEVGAAAYLIKSSTDDQLIETIENVLNQAAFHSNRKVLVVDDSSTIRRLVKMGLEEAGYAVLSAVNGLEALEILKKTTPDLILSDLDMPEMDGATLCETVKRDPQLSQIPFMVMSANSERATMRAMVARGVATYMVKPFNMEQLVITVEKILSEQFQLLLADRQRLNAERMNMIASITSLIQALEARDPYTRGHSDRVAAIVVEMAKIMGLSEEDQETLAIGARLHDLGKIGIPDALLLKNGPLTDEEIKIFNNHPKIGADILAPIPSLEQIIPVVLYHHERIDGRGYPWGLRGSDIPLWARITAVADTYDALTTDRPYRKGFTPEKATLIIREIQGDQLCPECVQAFFQWHDAQTVS